MSRWPIKREKESKSIDVDWAWKDGWNYACDDHLTARKKAVEELSVIKLRGLTAQAYCLPEHEKKVVDPRLLVSISNIIHEEIKRVLGVK